MKTIAHQNKNRSVLLLHQKKGGTLSPLQILCPDQKPETFFAVVLSKDNLTTSPMPKVFDCDPPVSRGGNFSHLGPPFYQNVDENGPVCYFIIGRKQQRPSHFPSGKWEPMLDCWLREGNLSDPKSKTDSLFFWAAYAVVAPA